MKKLFSTFFLAALFSSGYAQQDPQFIHYFSNQLFYNPAAAGAERNTSVNIAARSNLTEDEGAPLTISLTGDHYFKKIRSSFGVRSMYNAIGFQKTWNADLIYSFRIPVKKMFVQFGIDLGTTTLQMEGNFLPIQPGDPSIPTGHSSATAFTFSAGAYFWSRRFSAGASARNINQPQIKIDNLNGEPLRVATQYYLYFQYRQPIGRCFTLRPTFFVRTNDASTQIDASLLFYYYDWLYVGGGYRINNATTITIGVKALVVWVQYGYTIPTSTLNGYNSGEHEMMLRYTIPYKRK